MAEFRAASARIEKLLSFEISEGSLWITLATL
jgi:hypothetical protein